MTLKRFFLALLPLTVYGTRSGAPMVHQGYQAVGMMGSASAPPTVGASASGNPAGLWSSLLKSFMPAAANGVSSSDAVDDAVSGGASVDSPAGHSAGQGQRNAVPVTVAAATGSAGVLAGLGGYFTLKHYKRKRGSGVDDDGDDDDDESSGDLEQRSADGMEVRESEDFWPSAKRSGVKTKDSGSIAAGPTAPAVEA